MTLLLPKAGEDAKYCEDAIALASDLTSHALRIAVADGASSSSFSGVWAKLVASSFVNRAFLDVAEIQGLIPSLATEWSADVFGRDLPWHAMERAQRGAYTTLAALAIGVDGDWRAIAVGDSCMFQIRDSQMLSRFPLAQSEDFGNNPISIASDPSRNEHLEEAFRESRGLALPGDVFILATDAFSRFMIEMSHDSAVLQSLIAALEGEGTARMIVDKHRKTNRLHNDDIGVVVVRVS